MAVFRLVVAMAFLLLLPALQAGAAGVPPITVAFDHLSTGFELDGVHRDLPCESCHLNAVFKGTPRTCGLCHITGSVYNATPKTRTHIQSSNNCEACHNTISFRPDVHFDHREVMGACVSCHNGTIAQGKGPTHPQTSDACDACHTVMSWNPPKAVDHTQIPLAVQGFCIICHNGTSASGKPKNHIATNFECGDCHLTTTWLGVNFDHTGIKTGCFSCHNGVKAVGKQGNHMPTSTTCEACHTTGIGSRTPVWAPSAFDHNQMATTNTCLPCHNGTVKISTGFVSGLPANHVPLSSATPDCILCHGNNPAAETWTVLAADIPTLHTKLNTANCLMCHGGQTFAGVPAPFIPMAISGVSPYKKAPLAPPHIPVLAGTDCSACHGPAYRAGGFGPATAMTAATHKAVSTTCDVCHDSGKSFYVGSGTPLQLRPADHIKSTDPGMATGDCSACHNTTDWTSSTMPAGHMPNPSNLPCVTCHASAPNDYTPATLAANSKLHTGVAGKCGLCHGDNVTALTWANNYTPKDALLAPSHIPYLAGTDCSSCHSSSTYAVGTFGPMNMTSAKHAFVPTACDTCHEKGLSFTMGAASPALQGRPADHTAGQQLTGDCSGCHNTTDWTSNVMPPGHMPNPGGPLCTVCHTNPANYASLASTSVLHTGITTGNCSQCHGNYTAALTWYNNYTPKPAFGLTPSHIPYLVGTDCSSCHASNYVTGGFGPTNMSPAKHAFVPTTCDTCHDTGKSFYLGASTPALQTRPDGTGGTAAYDHIHNPSLPQMTAGDCSQCHNTTAWTTPKTLPGGHMPIPGTQVCTVCHIGGTNFAILASTPTLHTGITTGCGQCHGGATQLDFYHVTIPANFIKAAAPLSPPHMPSFTNNDCSACHKANYVAGGFGPMNMTQATHANVSNVACKTCHEAGLAFYMGAANPGLQGRPADHTGSLAAPADCSGCHNTANWNSTALPAGHMPNPANQACNLCHTSAPTNYKVFASNAVLHTGITGNCSQCHGAGTQLSFYNNDMVIKDNVLAPAHIPYLSGTDCGSCHKTTTHAAGTFGPMNMSQATHAFVTTACSTCHGTATVAFYMGAANPKLQLRPADHTTGTMLTGDCSGCHTTANWNSGTLPANHMPNPGNQACATCHTAAPTNYTTLASNAVLHTGIASSCITCHGAPNAAKPIYATNFSPKAASGLSPPHIPSAATPCESCHTATVFTAFSGTTMSSAKHTQLLANTGGTCDQCHGLSTLAFFGVSNLQTRPNDKQHSSGNASTKDCSSCHGTNGWNNAQIRKTAAAPATTKTTVGIVANTGLAGRSANTGLLSQSGVQLRGGLVTGGIAGGAGLTTGAGGTVGLAGSAASAIAGGATTMPGITRVNHAGVVANCFSCHNGVLAAGKGPLHVASNNACENCHTTFAWMPAHFDHRGVTATCASCHNGATAPGKPTRHIQTNQDCSACHGTIAWAPATFNHFGINATCQSCHNGVAATAKPIGHIPTTLDCGSCHSTLNWTTAIQSPPQKPLISRPKPNPIPRGAHGDRMN
jgi:hypothetical protein